MTWSVHGFKSSNRNGGAHCLDTGPQGGEKKKDDASLVGEFGQRPGDRARGGCGDEESLKSARFARLGSESRSMPWRNTCAPESGHRWASQAAELREISDGQPCRSASEKRPALGAGAGNFAQQAGGRSQP